MTTPVFDLTVEQGAYFTETFNWYGGGVVMYPIEQVYVGYPTRVKVTAHGLPTVSDTPVIISGVQGCEALNSSDLGIEQVAYVDVDHFDVPISTVNKCWTTGSGEITYHAPTDITNFTGRMKIRKNWHSDTVITELTTENGGMTLTVNDASIKIELTAAATAAFTFVKAVYDIELIAPGGTVTRVVKGTLTLDREITK